MRLHRALIPVWALAIMGGLTLAAPSAGAEGFGYKDLTPLQKRLVSGLLTDALGEGTAAATSSLSGAKGSSAPRCDDRRGSNVKVNQDCQTVSDPDLAGRGEAQNEPWIAANPFRPNQLVAAYNDYRRGDATCGISYSGDGGDHWTDTTGPTQFSRGTAYGGKPRQYWQGGGDPSVAWDSRGNVYLSCLHFKRGINVSPDEDQSSGLYVYRSTGTAGASFNFAGRPVAEHDDTAGAGNFLHDKQLMAVDHRASSPFRDRIYVTWTMFAEDGTAYIFGSYSSNFGETFSAPVLVSSDSALCVNTFGLPTPRGKCNVNQFSQPFIAPDGTLYVVWNNYNNALSGPGDNRNQVLLAKSTDGGVTYSAPVKVGDFYELPDCAAFQNGANPFRACVPEKGATFNSIFRAANYPYGSVNPANPSRVVITYGSYIGRNSNEGKGCTPAGFSATTGGNLYAGVKDGGCNNDIVISESTNAGGTFAGTAADVRTLPVVTDAPAQRTTDQFFHGMDHSPAGRLAVGYYDRQYGSANATGFSDISMSVRGGGGFSTRRVTGTSMAPASQFGGAFFGDYIAVSATRFHAYPIWSDTRAAGLFACPGVSPPAVCTAPASNANPANDEDIYTARVPLF